MDLDVATRTLLDPVDRVLTEAAARLGVALPARVRLADVGGFWGRDGDDVLLDRALASGTHPLDVADGELGLDRWRRATACVLEAAVDAALGSGGPAWLRTGLAIHRVDAAVPSLALAPPDVRRALGLDLVATPRGGVAVLRAWADDGGDPVDRAVRALADRVAVKDWVQAGRWLLGGGAGPALADRSRPAPRDVPAQLGPWTWAAIEVEAHRRGGHLMVHGRGGVAPAWAPAGERFRAVAGACEDGCRISHDPGGPVGTWEVRSALGLGRAMGARGLQFTFEAGGRLQVVLADAFVGAVADVEAAEQVGTSGVIAGRWAVDGPRRIRLSELVPQGVTLHGRDETPFAVPGDQLGLVQALQSMAEAPWGWTIADERLELQGRMFGGTVTVRLRPVWPDGIDA